MRNEGIKYLICEVMVLVFFSAPLHIVAKVLTPFFTFHNFPQTIITPNFSHEVAVVSLYTLFTLLGLIFTWLAVKE